MLCPSCKTITLVSHHLENSIPCDSCPQCSGVLLPLSAHTDEVVINKVGSDVSIETNRTEFANSKHALCCPNCQRVMVKFKVTADSAHTLDFCFSCAKVWLDSGEWFYLKSVGLHKRIRSITTDSWQHRLRDEVGAKLRIENFKQSVGQDAFSVIEPFRLWLLAQPKRDEILLHLSALD